MRMFVALVPPADAMAELAAAVEALQATPGLRWTRPEQWHVTLAFLAEVDDRAREALTPRLERVAHRHAPPTLALAGVPSDGAAGSIFESLSKLSCTLDPKAIKDKAGGGADCSFEPGN